MSNTHTGNIQPGLDLEEHVTISGVPGKKVFIIDADGNVVSSFGGSISAASFSIASGSAVDISQIRSNVTLNPSPNYIGLATIDIGSNNGVAIKGNVTLSDSKTYIGLATVTPGSSWPDPKTYIGLATIDIGSNNSVALKGNVTIDSGNINIKGNITLSDPKTYIGLTTVTIGSIPTISIQALPYSYYAQSSLLSGYVWHGFVAPGSNPTTANFRIQRETLNTGEILFASGAATFTHVWSAASLASITYL